MPRNTPDYKRTIIYKIFCNNPEISDAFFGHTTDFNKMRYYQKAQTAEKNSTKCKAMYHIIQSNGGWNNWNMIEVEKYPCDFREEAKMKVNDYKYAKF